MTIEPNSRQEYEQTLVDLTFSLLCRVGQQRRGENMHAVLIEKAEELRLLRFLQSSNRIVLILQNHA